MAFTYYRKDSPFIWGEWSDAAGNAQRGSMETTDEKEAKARVDELERRARVTDAPAAAAGVLTVEDFAKGEWLQLRKVAKPFAWRDDQSRLAHHFLPQFGRQPLEWLASDDGSRAVFSWAVGLKAHTAKRDGKPLAPRTVWNTFSTVRVLLDDAVELKRLKLNPLASFKPEKYLPTKADKRDDGWRESAGFTTDQVVALTTDARLAQRRRVWNTLAFIVGGARTGELANLRWQNWAETYKGGLGRMVIAKAYNSREGKEKATKTGAKKLIPVHPFAARVLKAWHDEGWKEWMGREPMPEDLIVPQSDGKQVRNWKLLAEFYADLDTLKIDRQRQYENRSTFRNLLLCAGAPEFIVNLMTHPSPKQASDFYTRLEMQWPAMCEAILKLDHPAWRPPPATVSKVTQKVTLATGTDGAAVGGAKNTSKNRAVGMEPTAGLEPATYGLRNRCSTD
jgi:integrase